MKNLHVFLVHGTWAGTARWTHSRSAFRKKLKTELENEEYTPTYKLHFDPFPWNGRLRSRDRDGVVEDFKEHIVETISNHRTDWDYLIVGHSHGGNIAADAVRSLLGEDSKSRVHEIVCLNTPFFKDEVRGSSAYLIVWFFIGLALWGASWANALNGFSLTDEPSLLHIPHTPLLWTLGCVTAFLLLLFVASIIVRKLDRNREGSVNSGPRPDVLCLSCSDDEAITFLGLGEGISNLPQLFLHPLALLFATIAAIFLFYSQDHLFCSERSCWHWELNTIAELFTIWVGIASLAGIFGASAVTFMFGLPRHHVLKTLVSRVLVSYTPLLPAHSFFRGINSFPIWRFLRHPTLLFHSAIFWSPQTFEAIREWLHRKNN